MTAIALLDKVDQTLFAVEAFCAVLDQETEALKAADYNTFGVLQDVKLKRAHDYQDAVLSFEGDLEKLKVLPDTAKNKLRAAHEKFTLCADKNRKTVAAAHKVSQRIVDMIMDAARRAVADGAPGYSKLAKQGLSDKIPVHFKLNEVL
jgi:hypothetical protein